MSKPQRVRSQPDTRPAFARTPEFQQAEREFYAKLASTRFAEDGKIDPNGELFHDLDPNNILDDLCTSSFESDRVWRDCPRCERCNNGVLSNGRRCRYKVDRFVHFDALAVDDEGNFIDPIAQQMEANAAAFGGVTTRLGDTPTAKAWQDLSHAANDLPRNYKRRRFVIDVCQVGCLASELLRRHDLTYEAARWTWSKFLRDVQLDHYRDLLVPGSTRA